MHSCIDGIGVSCPNFCATSWSSEVPASQIRALRLVRMRLGQEHRRRAEVIAADLGRRERLGVAHVGVADDGQVLPVGLERAEHARRQIERRSGLRRRPQVLLHAERRAAGRAVHHLDGDQPRAWRAERGAAPTPCRAGTIASSNGSATVTPIPLSTVPARQRVVLSDEHRCTLPFALSRSSVPLRLGVAIWNAPLLTMPRMNAEIRWSFLAGGARRSRAPPACRSDSTRRPSA